MKFLPLIWVGLWRKPVRTTFTVLSLIAAFLLFGLLRSVDAGFDNLIAAGQLNRLWVGARFFNTAMPVAYVDQISRVDGVTEVGYQAFANGYYQDPKTYFFVGGASANIFDVQSDIVAKRTDLDALHAKPNGVLISPAMAKHLGGVTVGTHLTLHSNDVAQRNGSHDWDLELIGFLDNKDAPGVFTYSFGNFEYINEARAEPRNVVQQIGVHVRDPEKAVQIARSIDALFANSGVPTRTGVDRVERESAIASIGNIKLMVNSIVTTVLFVLLLLTATSLAQSVDERTAEFGVMKTLGFTDKAVLNLVMVELLLQCLAGAVIGLSLSAVVSPMMQGRVLGGPPVFFHVPLSVFAVGLFVAAAIALLAAVIPAVRVSRLQVVEALVRR